MQIKNFPYHLFDDFLTAFEQQKSFVLNNQISGLFTKQNVEQTYEQFANNSQNNNGQECIDKDKPFDEVIKSIKGDDVQTMYHIINHAIWLWTFPHNTNSPWLVYQSMTDKTKKTDCPYKADLMTYKGVAGGGRGYRTGKTNGIRFILYLFKLLTEDKTKDAKNLIIGECLETTRYDSEQYERPDGVKNLLLHLCDSGQYEPIAFSADKQKLVDTFKKDDKSNQTIDKKIQEIRKKLQQKKIITEEDTFYSKSLPLLWKGEESSTDLSLAQKLEYKRAMILYGPPGTGKTYTAKQLAKEIIARHYYRQFKRNLNEENTEDNKESIQEHDQNDNIKSVDTIDAFSVFTPLEPSMKNRISYLQFHINYNYEDFIAGQVIEGNDIDTKKGFIFDVINKANEKPNDPYVVILDEINRTDISRVFGELFTAIEKRGETVMLTLPKPKKEIAKQKGIAGQQPEIGSLQVEKRLELNLPDNIYFIGTMNEIDFSLERVDFALRRRFIWELQDYSEDALENIIKYRFDHYPFEEWYKYYKRMEKNDEEAVRMAKEELEKTDSSNSEIRDRINKVKEEIKKVNNENKVKVFISSCTKLNNEVEKAMGEAYHIGHAFFAEIVQLFIELNKNDIDNPWQKAKQILWEISIKPTLEAYCGTMDKIEKEKYLKGQGGKFYDAFFKENPDNPTPAPIDDEAESPGAE